MFGLQPPRHIPTLPVASDRHAATLAVCPLHSESGQRADIPVCPLCANSVLTRCSKKALLFDHLSASASGAAAIIPRAAVRQSTIVKKQMTVRVHKAEEM